MSSKNTDSEDTAAGIRDAMKVGKATEDAIFVTKRLAGDKVPSVQGTAKPVGVKKEKKSVRVKD